MPKNITQTVRFDASPKAVYEALIDAKQHAAFTGSPAEIDPQPGGAVRCYGGYIRGFNLELRKNARIVQAWRGRDWPPGVYSIVRFDIARAEGGGCEVRLTQTGIPDDERAGISRGWRIYYWKPLAAYFTQPRKRR